MSVPFDHVHSCPVCFVKNGCNEPCTTELDVGEGVLYGAHTECPECLGESTQHTEQPICPHCGHVERDAWEIDFGGYEGDTETACGSCGRDYFVSRHCSVTYSTRAIERERAGRLG